MQRTIVIRTHDIHQNLDIPPLLLAIFCVAITNTLSGSIINILFNVIIQRLLLFSNRGVWHVPPYVVAISWKALPILGSSRAGRT